MVGWQLKLTPEEREQLILGTYAMALDQIEQAVAAGTITSQQVRNRLCAVMLSIDKGWDGVDYAKVWLQNSQD